MKFDYGASCREPLMQRDCVANEAQAVRYRAVCLVCDGGSSVKSCAKTDAILQSISSRDVRLTDNQKTNLQYLDSEVRSTLPHFRERTSQSKDPGNVKILVPL